jgi:hypothetical protein
MIAADGADWESSLAARARVSPRSAVRVQDGLLSGGTG